MKQLFESTIAKVFITLFGTTALICFSIRVNGDYAMIDPGGKLLLLATLISSFLYSIILAKADSTQIIYNHGSRLLFRFVILSLIPVVLWLQQWDYSFLTVALYAYTIFYIIFDAAYNNYKGEYPFYVGTVAVHDKIVRWVNSNRIMMKLFPAWFITFKMVLHLGAILLVMKYYWR